MLIKTICFVFLNMILDIRDWNQEGTLSINNLEVQNLFSNVLCRGDKYMHSYNERA